MLDNPIILMCSERSGSNLICRIFDAHSDICAPSPAHLLRVYGQNAHKYGPDDIADFADDFSSLLEHSMNSWRMEKKFAFDILNGSDDKNFSETLAELYAAEARLNDKAVLFIKENQIYKYISVLLAGCRNPRFLFLYRDPRDVASSWMLSPILKGGIVRASETWMTDQSEFLKLISVLKPSYRVAAVGYEQLLQGPETALQMICDKLGVEYDSNMLNYYSSSATRKHSQAAVDWRNTSKPVMQDNYNKFLQTLSGDQVVYIEKKCASLMRIFGYDPVEPEITDDEFINLHDRLSLEEPMEKKSYQNVSQLERSKREEWGGILKRIESRPAVFPM